LIACQCGGGELRVKVGTPASHRSVCSEKPHGCQSEGKEVGYAESVDADDVLVLAL
jgi:hypothetical protein